MAPTLNQEDIKLLEGIFPTKTDLKKELSGLEKKLTNQVDQLEKKMDQRFDEVEVRIGKYSVHVETRLHKLEDEVGIPHPN